MSAPSRSGAVALVAVAALAGCGQSKSPEHVVRDWVSAVNAGDNQRAGELFALGARVTSGELVRIMRTREQAVAFNAGLPFSMKGLNVTPGDGGFTATFTICARATHECGEEKGSLFFLVRNGKIVRWDQ